LRGCFHPEDTPPNPLNTTFDYNSLSSKTHITPQQTDILVKDETKVVNNAEPVNVSNDKGKELSQTQDNYLLPTILMIIPTVIVAIATGLIAWSSHISNRILHAGSMPVLIFFVDRKKHPAWILKNVGKGIALNVLVVHENSIGEIGEPIRDYNCLSPEDHFRIKWEEYPYKLIAQYQDVYQNKYTVVCVKNINSIHHFELYKNWHPKKKRPLWQMIEKDEVYNN
jgi:hypothetical protein